jgi:4-hydroxyphenylacetate 3-monooxygenase
MTTLVLEDAGVAAKHVVHVRRVLIAGFTGRDSAAVAEHVEELAAMGAPVPDATPTLYRLGPDMVHQTPALVVHGANTSGEVEPVLVVAEGQRLLSVGSDHTDRDLERRDIAASKAACHKVIATSCVPVAAVKDWDAVELRSDADGVPYQQGLLRSLLPLDTLLNHLEENEGIDLQDGDVLFLGTVPVQGNIRPSHTFSASLRVPGADPEIAFSYRVIDVSSTRRTPLTKPELEFFDADEVKWTPVDGGVAGQTERILATDPESGISTRMLRFEPETDTSELGVLRHDFWEEVYILSGGLHDLTLDEFFGPGTYACRPPGMPHGPWKSPEGCVTFEVRYPAT